MKKNNPMFREDVKAKLKETHKFLYGVDNPSKREDVKKKISEKRGSTGIYRVRKKLNKQCVQGFTWVYQCEDGESFSSTSLEKLFKKMEDRNIPLIIVDEINFNQTLKDGMVGYGGGE